MAQDPLTMPALINFATLLLHSILAFFRSRDTCEKNLLSRSGYFESSSYCPVGRREEIAVVPAALKTATAKESRIELR